MFILGEKWQFPTAEARFSKEHHSLFPVIESPLPANILGEMAEVSEGPFNILISHMLKYRIWTVLLHSTYIS